MEDDFCEKTISVALAFQRELAYRKKLESELGPDNGMLKNLVPLQEQFSIPCPISDHPNSSTLRSSSTNPFSHSDLQCKRPNSNVSSTSLLAKRKEPPTSSSTRPLSHSNLYCKVCKVECSGRFSLEQHLRGHKHRSKLEELDKWQRRWCHLCGVPCSNEDALKKHFEGKKHKHRSKLEELDKWQRRWCHLCGVPCSNEDALKKHFEGKKHKHKLLKSEESAAVKRRR